MRSRVTRELLADFFQRVVGVHAEAEAHAQDALFALGERGEHVISRRFDWIPASIGRIAFLSSRRPHLITATSNRLKAMDI